METLLTLSELKFTIGINKVGKMPSNTTHLDMDQTSQAKGTVPLKTALTSDTIHKLGVIRSCSLLAS